jgi:hypothetical protein
MIQASDTPFHGPTPQRDPMAARLAVVYDALFGCYLAVWSVDGIQAWLASDADAARCGEAGRLVALDILLRWHAARAAGSALPPFQTFVADYLEARR